MMPELSDHDEASEDIDDVYPVHRPDHVLRRQERTEFRPWHHPRKQYVRIHQWCTAAERLIKDLKLGNGDPFRYLTLPGNDFLDVRTLHGVCETANVKLRYLGFNSVAPGSSEQAELNLSQNEVRSLTAIDPHSQVVEDRLESLANDRSPALRSTSQRAPFHAINIDLCDSIAFRDADDPKGSMLAALGQLLKLQRQTTTSWLLFITTRAQPGLVCSSARDGFMSAIAENAAASAEFREKLAELVSVSAGDLDAALGAAWSGEDANFIRVFCTGLSKWLLSLLGNAQPPRELILLSSCCYQVGPAGPDMLSLAFRCNTPPQSVQDPHGILVAAGSLATFSEVDAALRMVKKVAGTMDLDQMLARDPELATKLISQAGRLLASASYRADAYEAWAVEQLGRRMQLA
ncbi:MAG: hypothetical protein HQL39_02445 [Alphaproteobacteria bacterium]|nr:hypothetical protein [Alphaproteobacteria bacterium]